MVYAKIMQAQNLVNIFLP